MLDEKMNFNGEYMFAPGQLVTVTLSGFNEQEIDIPAIIKSMEFMDSDIGPTPLANIWFLTKWSDGSISGFIDMKLVPHRYCKKPFDPKMVDLELFKGVSDCSLGDSSIFYLNGDEKIYPFKEKED